MAGVRVGHVISMAIVAIIGSVGGSVLYTNHVQHQTEQVRQQAEQATKAQQTASLKITCNLVSTMEDFYKGLNTPTATKVADSWEVIRQFAQCPPVK